MPPATDIPDTHQCVSHHSHITPRTTNGPTMCQPPLSHSQAPTLPNTNNPGKQPIPRHRFQPNSPLTHKCASHHWHIARAPTLPRHNNRRKQPIHGMRPATDTSDIRKCASHRSHIAPQTTISPAMRQPPLTHSTPGHLTTHPNPNPTHNRTPPPESRRPLAAMRL